MHIVSAATTANDNDVAMTPQRNRAIAGDSINAHMGRTLDDSAGMGEPQVVAVLLEATMRHLRSLAAQMPCNACVGGRDLWDVVGLIAARVLPFATGLHEFDEQCHHIRSFVGQAITHPAFEVSGTSRMGRYILNYATMQGMMRVTVSDGERSTGFGILLETSHESH